MKGSEVMGREILVKEGSKRNEKTGMGREWVIGKNEWVENEVKKMKRMSERNWRAFNA